MLPKTLGNDDLRFLIFVAIDGYGLAKLLYVLLNGLSPSSSSFFLVISFGGFALCSGNGSNVQWLPTFGGFDGLNGFS